MVIQLSSKSTKVAVLGSGTWGITLARLLALNERTVALWSRSAQRVEELLHSRRIQQPLSIEIPEQVEITDDIEACVRNAEIILLCCSAQSMRQVAGQLAQKALPAKVAGRSGGQARLGPGNAVLVSAAKGLELETLSRMSEILHEVLPGYPVCALSGPNLAKEVLSSLPTASVVASSDEEVARFAQMRLSAPNFRLYTNADVPGVEFGGALKNIIAIAAGVGDGFDLGTNAKSALTTRGLAEMVRLSTAMGARPSTLSGLAGMGDLIATCYSSLSRNYRLGFQMAKGQSAEQAQKELGAVAEGATTVHAVCQLSKKLDIRMPIAEQVAAALTGEITPQKAIMNLMTRPLSSE